MNELTNTPAQCYGEILWDILPDGPQPGGAPLNVAYHLNKLGLKAAIISRIGYDDNGRKLASLLKEWDIPGGLLQTDLDYPTSEVIARMNNGNEVTYDILYPVAWDFIEPLQNFDKQDAGSKYLVYGSLSSRSDTSRKTLFELLEKTDAVTVFDINLRPPFIKKEILQVLLKKAGIIKFNQAELEMVQLMFGGSYGNERSQVRFIQDYFAVREIVVTKGEFGASYYLEEKAFHVSGREVKVTDTIGSGDSFLAAFIASHFMQEPPVTILKNAIAMGAFIATKKGGCPDYELKEYENFKANIF